MAAPSDAPLPDGPRPFDYVPPPAGPLPLLHIDDDLLVLDKPSGLLTVPGNRPERADCLESRVQAEFPEARIIHRLDMDTSGVIVLARTAHAQRHIGLQFEKRQTRKTYEALVWGEMSEAAGQVDQPLITDWPNRPKQHIDPKHGRHAITNWKALERGDGWTRVSLSPLSGRSHQLRVHMTHLGHPILGDNLYAHAQALAARPRLCLHARCLGLRHPADGRTLEFDSPVPF